jgi:hypothetical protein
MRAGGLGFPDDVLDELEARAAAPFERSNYVSAAPGADWNLED